DETTVEQIADAAEVSPSTFFRYFPTKEDVVLQDDMDLLWLEVYRAQPPGLGPLAAMRNSLRVALDNLDAADLGQLREAMDLAMTVPAVRARMLEELARTMQIVAEADGDRAGEAARHFEVAGPGGAVGGRALAR